MPELKEIDLDRFPPHEITYHESGMPIMDLGGSIPPGWITDAIDHLNLLSDAPIQYKAITAIQVLSITLGHRAVFTFAGAPRWCNLFTLLAGPPVFTRKSHISKLGMTLLRQTGIKPLATDFTSEGIIRELSKMVDDRKFPGGFIFFTEFSRFIKSTAKQYNESNAEFMNELYDCSEIHRTLSKGKFSIDNPVISVIACSTPAWIRDSIHESDIGGGFWARFIIIPAETPPAESLISWPAPRKDQFMEATLTKFLQSVAEKSISFSFSQDARLIYDQWYKKTSRDCQSHPDSDLLSSFVGRAQESALKLACIFHISSNPAKHKVEASSMLYACRFAEYIIECHAYLFGKAFIKETKYQKRKEELVRWIEKETAKQDGPVPNRTVQQKAYTIGIRLKDFQEIQRELKAEGRLKLSPNGKRGAMSWTILKPDND